MIPAPTAAAPRVRATLWMLTALSALAFMDRQIVAVLLLPVKSEFGLTDLQAGLVTGFGFALGFALLGLPLGRLADRHDRIRVVAWCRGIGGALAALGAAAVGAWTLAATRIGGAVSDAGGGPGSMAVIADLYPPEQRSRAMGTFAMGASLGSLLALVGGAWLAQHHGWRFTLAAIGLATLVAAVALRWTLGEPARGRRGAGAGHAAVGGRPAAAGAVRTILREPVARRLIVAAAFALLAGYSFGAWNFAYLMRWFGLSSTQAGALTGLAALGSLLGAPVAGALADRLVRRHRRWQMGVPIIGLALALPCGLAYLSLGPTNVELAVALVCAFAFFVAFWIGPTYAALSMVVPPDRRGTANALMLLVGAVGGNGIGPVLTGGLSDLLAGHVAGDPLRPALAAMLLLLLVAIGALAWAARDYARLAGEAAR